MASNHFLIKLAKLSLNHYLTYKQELSWPVSKAPLIYRKKQAVFVTLFDKHKIVGQAGQFISFEPIYLNLMKAVIKAVGDKKINQTIKINNLKIEILIIDTPKQFFFDSPSKLISFLSKNKPGVILKLNNKQAYLLPSVWQRLPQPDDFLSALCRKLKADSLCWQKPQTQIFTFKAQKVSGTIND